MAKRPPIATVKRCDSPRSCSSGGLEERSGGCGDASEDVVGKLALPIVEDPASEVAAVDRETRQPCRPSYERPSKLVAAESRKYAFTAGANGQGEAGGTDGNLIGEGGSFSTRNDGAGVAQLGAAAAGTAAVSNAEGRPTARENGSSRGGFRDSSVSPTSAMQVEKGLVSERKQAGGDAREFESKGPPDKSSPAMEEYADEAFESDGEISRSR